MTLAATGSEALACGPWPAGLEAARREAWPEATRTRVREPIIYVVLTGHACSKLLSTEAVE